MFNTTYFISVQIFNNV